MYLKSDSGIKRLDLLKIDGFEFMSMAIPDTIALFFTFGKLNLLYCC